MRFASTTCGMQRSFESLTLTGKLREEGCTFATVARSPDPYLVCRASPELIPDCDRVADLYRELAPKDTDVFWVHVVLAKGGAHCAKSYVTGFKREPRVDPATRHPSR